MNTSKTIASTVAADTLSRRRDASPASEDVVEPEQAMAALARVLDSPLFAKSPCMRRLLRFVVQHSVTGDLRRLTEYSIGLEALGKDPNLYSPGDDPSVRVQMGRLRDRLRRYYEEDGSADTVRFEIPQGSYATTVSSVSRERRQAPFKTFYQVLVLDVIEGVGDEPAILPFARGLREELLHGLFGELHGLAAVAVPARDDADAREADYRLEGGVRQAAGMLRATMRLIDARSHCLIWSARFDHAADDVLRAQEALAASISLRLKQEVFAASASAAFAHAHAVRETFKIS